jgi:hypothetical protein
LPLIVVLTLLGGVARSIGATAYTTLGYSDVTEAEMPHANGLAATAQQLAAAFGIAAATILLRLGTAIGALFSAHPGKASAYTAAFLVLGLVSLAATIEATRLPPEVGSAVRAVRAESPRERGIAA